MKSLLEFSESTNAKINEAAGVATITCTVEREPHNMGGLEDYTSALMLIGFASKIKAKLKGAPTYAQVLEMEELVNDGEIEDDDPKFIKFTEKLDALTGDHTFKVKLSDLSIESIAKATGSKVADEESGIEMTAELNGEEVNFIFAMFSEDSYVMLSE